MNTPLVFPILIFLLLFPSLTLYSIGDTPILRIDIISQILLILILLYNFLYNKYHIRKYSLVFLSFSYICIVLIPFITHVFTKSEINYFEYLQFSTSLLFQYIIIILFVQAFFDKDNCIAFKWLTDILLIALILVGVLSFFQFILVQFFSNNILVPVFNSHHFEGQATIASFMGVYRPTGIFNEPSYLAFILQIPIILMLQRKMVFFYLNSFILFLVYVIIVLTFIITSSIASFVSLIFALTVTRTVNFNFLVTLVIIVFVIAFTFDIGPGIRFISYDKLLLGDFNSITDGSTLERLGKVNGGFQAFFNNLFYGVGLNNLITFQPKFENWYEYSDQIAYVNIYFLQIIAESGVLGLIGLFSFFISFYLWFRNSRTCIKCIMCLFLANYAQIDLPFTSPLRLFYLIFMVLVFNYPSKLNVCKK